MTDTSRLRSLEALLFVSDEPVTSVVPSIWSNGTDVPIPVRIAIRYHRVLSVSAVVEVPTNVAPL